jgi:hypothetical protein
VDNQPLHPNLARIAASYDEVHRRFGLRMIDAQTAHAEILALQARDDEGVVWRLDPRDGSWLRKTREGTWVPGQAPRSGLATPTAHDYSRDPHLFNPDSRIRFDAAPDAVVGMYGATRSLAGEAPARRSSGLSARSKRLLATLALVLALGAGLRAVASGDSTAPAPEVPTSDIETAS